MPDRLHAGLDALEQVPVPVTWDDVRSRQRDAEADPTPRRGGPNGRRPPRLLLAAAILLVIVVAGGALALREVDDTTTIDTSGSPSDDDAAAPISGDGRLFEAARLAAVAAYEMRVETELAVLLAATGGEPEARRAWEDQVSTSDEAIRAMREQMDSLDVDALDDVTKSSLSLVERTADSPRTARSVAGSSAVEWPSALEVYDNITGAFTEASSRLANSVSSPELSKVAQTWTLAVQIEADVADQRARLTGVFADGWFQGPIDVEPAGGQTYESFLATVDAEQRHTRTLDDFGDPDTVDRVRDALSGNEVSFADDLRERAIDGQDSTDLGVDVDVWREASGRKLARIHDVQVQIAESILARADQASGGADRDPLVGDGRWPLVAVGILLLLVAVGLAFLAGRRAGRSLAPREPLEG
jgi:hypothetical protein